VLAEIWTIGLNCLLASLVLLVAFTMLIIYLWLFARIKSSIQSFVFEVKFLIQLWNAHRGQYLCSSIERHKGQQFTSTCQQVFRNYISLLHNHKLSLVSTWNFFGLCLMLSQYIYIYKHISNWNESRHAWVIRGKLSWFDFT
jgi:hypothetical protein